MKFIKMKDVNTLLGMVLTIASDKKHDWAHIAWSNGDMTVEPIAAKDNAEFHNVFAPATKGLKGVKSIYFDFGDKVLCTKTGKIGIVLKESLVDLTMFVTVAWNNGDVESVVYKHDPLNSNNCSLKVVPRTKEHTFAIDDNVRIANDLNKRIGKVVAILDYNIVTVKWDNDVTENINAMFLDIVKENPLFKTVGTAVVKITSGVRTGVILENNNNLLTVAWDYGGITKEFCEDISPSPYITESIIVKDSGEKGFMVHLDTENDIALVAIKTKTPISKFALRYVDSEDVVIVKK